MEIIIFHVFTFFWKRSENLRMIALFTVFDSFTEEEIEQALAKYKLAQREQL